MHTTAKNVDEMYTYKSNINAAAIDSAMQK